MTLGRPSKDPISREAKYALVVGVIACFCTLLVPFIEKWIGKDDARAGSIDKDFSRKDLSKSSGVTTNDPVGRNARASKKRNLSEEPKAEIHKLPDPVDQPMLLPRKLVEISVWLSAKHSESKITVNGELANIRFEKSSATIKVIPLMAGEKFTINVDGCPPITITPEENTPLYPCQ